MRMLAAWLPAVVLVPAAVVAGVEITHETGQDEDLLAGFCFLAIPMAAWLAGRRIARPGLHADPAPEPL